MAESKIDKWAELRKPFPKEVIGQLPRGGIKLDFVGHAAVTDRLNTVVGPENWSLEPLAFNEDGTPVITLARNKAIMWARLTILGASKICVGTTEANKFDVEKELIGDALRNGAMRFGVALDLWTKDELESTLADPSLKNDKPSKRVAAAPKTVELVEPPKEALATPIQRRQISASLMARGYAGEDQVQALIEVYHIARPHEMSYEQAKTLLERFNAEKVFGTDQ